MPSGWVEFYKDAKGKWRWRQTAANGRVIGASSQSFSRKWSAKRNYKRATGA